MSENERLIPGVTHCGGYGGEMLCREDTFNFEIEELKQQLADCTRAMREVSDTLRSWGSGETWCSLADKLDAARAGKAGA